MHRPSRRTLRGLAATGALVPLLLVAAACSSGSASPNTASNAAGAAPAAAQSADAAMPADSPSMGAMAGMPGMNNGGAGASVTITEKMGPPDQYAFSPSKVTVASGQSLTIVNKSDESHTLSCTPNMGMSMAMMTVAKAGTQTMTFSKAGTYKCVSKTHKTAKITITVQ